MLFMGSFFFAISLSYILCLFSYIVSRFSAQLILLLLFYVCSAILGGGMQAAMYALIRLFGRTGLFKEGISFQTFAVLSGVLSAAAVAAGRIFKAGRPSKRVEADISFRNGLNERFCFICDTGNVLTDPYSGSPVIVMSAKAAERLKGLDLQTLLCDKTPDGNAALDAHFRYIPARSACGTHVFPAFRPESIELIVNGKNIKADAVIALDADKSNTYCGTDGILPAELVENI